MVSFEGLMQAKILAEVYRAEAKVYPDVRKALHESFHIDSRRARSPNGCTSSNFSPVNRS
jgi:hypothetical protein